MLFQRTEKQGFSSEQQPDMSMEERSMIKRNTEAIDHERIQLTTHFNVQPAEEIRDKHYSLQPDMLSGWKPKLYFPKPIPLIFYNDQLDFAIEKLIKMKTFKKPNDVEQKIDFIELVYLGPRYQSTYSAWYQKPFPFPYTHLNQNKRLKFTDREFVGQYWNAQTSNHLHFDSFFESGNLDVVFKIAECEYELFMRVDSNTRGHLQWYNFKVKNMIKGTTYKFNISNFQKGKSLYNRGMKPFILSMRENEQKGINWHQGGQNIRYEKKTPKSFKICKVQIQHKPHRLSFQYQCQYDSDQIHFAYCIPYQYSRLQRYLSNLQKINHNRNIIKVSRMANSLGGLEIPVVTITSELKQTNQCQITRKKLIVASGRIHPGESNGSFMMEGFVEYLCSNTEEAEYLRTQVVFKIIPMLNPDGVVLGNYRTSLSGKDLNREFIHPDQQIFPQIYNLKKYIARLRRLYKKDFLMYLDFHGHSTKKNCFTYGPEFSITNTNYYQCRLFPKLMSTQTEMFRYFSCVFKISQCKQSTLRAVLLKYFELDFVYTLEISNGSYYNHELHEDVLFCQQKWQQMGQKTAKSVFQYVMIFIELQKFKQLKKQQRFSLRKQKDKLIIKNNMLKRQVSTISNKDRASNSITTTKSTSPDKHSSAKMSPSRRKGLVTSHHNLQDGTKISDSFNDSFMKLQNIQQKFMIPQLKDEKLNFLLKSIYCGNNKKVNSSDEQMEENKSIRSDDNISQGGSDSSSSSQDLDEMQKKNLFKSIKLGAQKLRSLHSPKKKSYSKHLSIVDHIPQNSQQQNQPQMFLTEIDNSSNSIQQLNSNSKLNSIKMNQLRSKKHIYLKKKSYYIYNSSSPKKQLQNSQAAAAKIINFQFSLNPIRTANKIWHEKQPTTNSIHSVFKQNSKEKIDRKSRNIPLLDYMNKSFTQRNQEEQSRPEYFVTNVKRRIYSAQKDKAIKPNCHISLPKNYNIALLKKTQEKKLNVSSNFYKSQSPDKDIQEGNLKVTRILSENKKGRCVTSISAYQ